MLIIESLYAAARSSLSSPRITIFNASSGNGRCNAFASSHGARIHASRSCPSSGSRAWPCDRCETAARL